MKPIIKELMLKPVKEYFLMTVGMIMYSFAWIGCILPAKGVGGGAAGLSLSRCCRRATSSTSNVFCR